MQRPRSGCFVQFILALAILICSSPGVLAQSQRNLGVSTTHANEQRLALVIGNGSYKDAPLANPANDAQDIAKALADLGFKVTLRTNAHQRAMKQAIREFGAQLKQGGVGLFYFAGHGIQSKGRNYLVPVGASINGEADLEDESVDSNLILAHMEEAQNRVNIVVLDACRNNPFARSFRSAARGLSQIDAARGNFIAFATAPGQVANDGTGRNGTYTKHLLQSLRQSGSDVERVFKRVAAGVAQETSGKQVPWVSSSLTGDFYFRATDAGAVGQSTPAPHQAPARAAVDPLTVELAFWDSIRNSTNPSDFKAYLDQFPDGRFAALARTRSQAPAPQAASAAPPVTLALASPSSSAASPGSSRLGSPSNIAALSLGPVSSSFPSKPVRLVVPFSPGEATDFLARTIAQKAAELSGQPFIIDNRPGAGGIIGADMVAKSAADGYTLLVAASSHAINPSIFSNLPFDAVRAFAPVTLLGIAPSVLVVHPAVPANSVQDLVSYARANPGKLAFASFGNGSSAHFAAEMLKSATGINLVHVAYKGSAPALTDLMAGQVQLMFAIPSAVQAHISSGKLKALAVASPQRSPMLPNVPTLAEGGLAGFEMLNWTGLLAPAGTPRDVINRLNQLVVRALNSSDVKDKIVNFGMEPLAGSPDGTQAYIEAEISKYRRVAQASGIRAD